VSSNFESKIMSSVQKLWPQLNTLMKFIYEMNIMHAQNNNILWDIWQRKWPLLFDHVDNQESVLSSPLLSLQHGSIRSKWIIPNHQNPMRQSKIANLSDYISIPLLGSTSWTFICLLPFIVSKCFWGSNLQITCSLVLKVLRTYLSS